MNTNVLAPVGAVATWGVLQLADATPLDLPLAAALVVLTLVIPVVRTRLEIWKQDRFAALTTAQRRDLIKLERAKASAGPRSS